MTNDMNVMIKTVENYIQQKKGRQVRIVFNNIKRFSEHLEMLRLAYHHVIEESKK